MGKGCYQSFEIALGKTTGHKVSAEEQDRIAMKIMSQLLANGVLPPVVKSSRMTITPPLIIGDDDLDAGLDVMLSVIKNVKPI
jgi:4-aminobutyrate aminotransferase-like enzyme